VSKPQWYIGESELQIKDKINYLGIILDSKRGLSHAKLRISKANKAFYSLQSAGLCNNVSSPITGIHVYKTVVQSGLFYGCCAIDISKANIFRMEKQQGTFIRTVLGLSYKTHTSQLLEAVNVTKVYKSIQMSSLDLLKSSLCNTSVARYFYAYLLHSVRPGKCNSLVDRSVRFWANYGINLTRYLTNKSYVGMVIEN
jgi:hypothetical protein